MINSNLYINNELIEIFDKISNLTNIVLKFKKVYNFRINSFCKKVNYFVIEWISIFLTIKPRALISLLQHGEKINTPSIL
jgi:hypothetical protein